MLMCIQSGFGFGEHRNSGIWTGFRWLFWWVWWWWWCFNLDLDGVLYLVLLCSYLLTMKFRLSLPSFIAKEQLYVYCVIKLDLLCQSTLRCQLFSFCILCYCSPIVLCVEIWEREHSFPHSVCLVGEKF